MSRYLLYERNGMYNDPIIEEIKEGLANVLVKSVQKKVTTNIKKESNSYDEFCNAIKKRYGQSSMDAL